MILFYNGSNLMVFVVLVVGVVGWCMVVLNFNVVLLFVLFDVMCMGDFVCV